MKKKQFLDERVRNDFSNIVTLLYYCMLLAVVISLLFALSSFTKKLTEIMEKPGYYTDYTVVEKYEERPFIETKYFLVVEDNSQNRLTIAVSKGEFYAYEKGSALSCHLTMRRLDGTYEIVSSQQSVKSSIRIENESRE